MKIFFISALICLISSHSCSQSLKEFSSGFTSIFKDRSEINSYYFGGNPALLSFDTEDELLTLGNDLVVDEGKFKRFIDPASNRYYTLSASGKKSVDSTQKFRGSFGFQRFERRSWQWIFTRDYNSGNPFLLGDSTTGNTRLNGIVMNAQYVNSISENFSAGISIDYSVDEALKEISPRPTSEHRDIHSIVGINYRFNRNLNLGLIAGVSDINEKISYREDEGGITQETVILKFKGYDLPNVFRKKTETRYSYSQEYSGGITFYGSSTASASAAGYFITGFTKNIIKDDAIDPRAEGFWKNNFIKGGLQFSAAVNKYLTAGFIYNYLKGEGWAEYSPYNVLYYEKNENQHSIVTGVQQQLSENISAGVEGGISFYSIDEQDYYSTVSCFVKSNIIHVKGGIAADLSQSISSIISYGYSYKSVSEYSFYSDIQTNYLHNYRKYDLIYLYTPFNMHEVTSTLKLSKIFSGTFYIYLNYSVMMPQENQFYIDTQRCEFNSVIEYRIKVF